MKAYYFSTLEKTLRYGDNRKIEEGITHTVEGIPVLCEHGLHASKRAIDALQYAPGSFLWIVELSGEIVEGADKVVATERTYIKGFDATNMLKEFSRKVALINIEKIKPYCSEKDYTVILRYLVTGDEELRSTVVLPPALPGAAWAAGVWSAVWSVWAARFVARFVGAAESVINETLEEMIEEMIEEKLKERQSYLNESNN